MSNPSLLNNISIPIPPCTTFDIGESRMAANITVTGAPGGAWSAVVPTTKRTFYFFNDTNQTATVKTALGISKTVVAGASAMLYCDGTNVDYPKLNETTVGTYDVNSLRIAAAVQDGETVTIGADVYEFDTTAVAAVAAGHIRMDVSGGDTLPAKGTLTVAVNPTAGDTITIGAVTYRFETSLAQINDIKIGASAAATQVSIQKTLNGTGVAGTDNFAGTVASTVVSCGTFSVNAGALTARIPGTVGNAIVTTSSFTNIGNFFDGTTLGTTQAGVDPTATEASAAFVAAVSSTSYTVARVGNNESLLTMSTIGSQAVVTTETMAGSGNAWNAAATYGGDVATQGQVSVQSRVPNAQEITLDHMHFQFAFTPFLVIVRVTITSSGLQKLWDGKYTVAAGHVTVDNSGSTDWATTDTVDVLAMG